MAQGQQREMLKAEVTKMRLGKDFSPKNYLREEY